MPDQLSFSTFLGTVGSLAALQFLVSLWLAERFKAQLQRENASILEAIRWELRAREQAAKVAEFMAEARDIDEKDPAERYRKLNKMSWELALWLPTEVYRSMAKAMTTRDADHNELSVLVQVRKHLLGANAGTLGVEDIVFYAPGAGKHRAFATQ